MNIAMNNYTGDNGPRLLRSFTPVVFSSLQAGQSIVVSGSMTFTATANMRTFFLADSANKAFAGFRQQGGSPNNIFNVPNSTASIDFTTFTALASTNDLATANLWSRDDGDNFSAWGGTNATNTDYYNFRFTIFEDGGDYKLDLEITDPKQSDEVVIAPTLIIPSSVTNLACIGYADFAGGTNAVRLKNIKVYIDEELELEDLEVDVTDSHVSKAYNYAAIAPAVLEKDGENPPSYISDVTLETTDYRYVYYAETSPGTFSSVALSGPPKDVGKYKAVLELTTVGTGKFDIVPASTTACVFEITAAPSIPPTPPWNMSLPIDSNVDWDEDVLPGSFPANHNGWVGHYNNGLGTGVTVFSIDNRVLQVKQRAYNQSSPLIGMISAPVPPRMLRRFNTVDLDDTSSVKPLVYEGTIEWSNMAQERRYFLADSSDKIIAGFIMRGNRLVYTIGDENSEGVNNPGAGGKPQAYPFTDVVTNTDYGNVSGAWYDESDDLVFFDNTNAVGTPDYTIPAFTNTTLPVIEYKFNVYKDESDAYVYTLDVKITRSGDLDGMVNILHTLPVPIYTGSNNNVASIGYTDPITGSDNYTKFKNVKVYIEGEIDPGDGFQFLDGSDDITETGLVDGVISTVIVVEENETCVLITALYKNDGELKEVKIRNAGAVSAFNGYKILTTQHTVNDAANSYIKAYLWEDFSGLQPILPSKEFYPPQE